jgi:hypothetical protein
MIDDIRASMEIGPKPEVTLHTVAHRHDVAVVDDVYVDWIGLAKAARGLPFSPALGAFPGLRASARIRTPGIDLMISRLLASDHLLEVPERVVFSILSPLDMFGEEQTVPHRDADVEISGVIYLCASDAEGEGTGFFRHRPSGLSAGFIGSPELEDAVRASPFPTVDQFLSDLSRPGPERNIYGPGPSRSWELTLAVALRPNRLVLFDSRLFHAALSPRRQTTRLTQNLFLRAHPRKGYVQFRALY